jgi:uncharacterized iron-regulated membrane protein
MRSFKFFWTTHKWTGIALSAVFLCTAATGFTLLIKKKVDWIQPPTMNGESGAVEDFITVQRLFEVVLEQGHADFTSAEDVDRVDFRPGKRVFKVQSVRNHSEIQVCAVTGSLLRVDTRRSDLLEDIHDGSFFGEWFHAWVMPLVCLGLGFLALSGLWLWIEPKVRKRRRKRLRAMGAADPPMRR